MKNLFRFFSRAPSANDAVERWALRHANKTSAEEIIAAAVIQSFAKDFDKWLEKDFNDPEEAWLNSSGWLQFPAKDIVIAREPQRKGEKYRFQGMKVNDVEMPRYLEKAIVDGWNKIAARVLAANATADKAKQEMDVSDKAWGIAENLLGFKRENGALVPKETVE